MNSSAFQELAVSFTGDTTGLAAAAADAARLMDGVAPHAGLGSDALAGPVAGDLAGAEAVGGLAPAGQDAGPGLDAAADALLGAAEALGLAGEALASNTAHEQGAGALAAAPLFSDVSAAQAGAASPGAIQASVTNNITQSTTLRTDIEDPEKAALKLLGPLDRLIQERAGLGFLEAVRQVSLLLASQGAR